MAYLPLCGYPLLDKVTEVSIVLWLIPEVLVNLENLLYADSAVDKRVRIDELPQQSLLQFY